MTNKSDKGAYLDNVRETTRQYIAGLLEEIEATKTMIASLERDNERLLQQKIRLQEQLLELRQELDRHDADQSKMQRRLLDIERQNTRYAEQYLVVEQQNANLANLYVASYQLHGTLDRGEVIEAIKEILINLVGSEQFGIFELSGDGEALELIGSFGIDEAVWGRIPAREGVVGRVLEQGRTWISGRDPAPVPQPLQGQMVACTPLRAGEALTGAIVIQGLLQQKPTLEAVDHELLDLLATHAATALYLTRLHAEAVDVAAAG